jgi:hypothetical protein
MESGEAPLAASEAGNGVILQPMEFLRDGIASSRAYLFHSCRVSHAHKATEHDNW